MSSRKLIRITMHRLVLVMLVAVATWIASVAQPTRLRMSASGEQSQSATSQQPFTADERARIGKQALSHLQKAAEVKNQRLRVLSVTKLSPEKDDAQTAAVGVVVFNYSQGTAKRLIIDPSNGAVLREETLRGRPQASEEELEEARQILRSDTEHGRLLEGGGVLEGGFVVDDPGQQSTTDRFIQFQILTSDRQNLQRFVTVNLTAGRIAESRRQ
jgi:hypothetical protein